MNINSSNTQRLNSDSLVISPNRKGIHMVPIRSKQSEVLDSLDQENTGDEEHADAIPNVRKKKNKRNIARDFNTHGKTDRKLNYDDTDDTHEGIQNPFVSPNRNKHPLDLRISKDLYSTPFDVNYSPEDDEYGSDEKFTIRKPQLFNIEEKKLFPDSYESNDAYKNKNTPLKSMSTKTKESLSGAQKGTTPAKSFESKSINKYDSIMRRRQITQPHIQDSPTIVK